MFKTVFYSWPFSAPCKSDMISIYWLISFAYYDENLIEY